MTLPELISVAEETVQSTQLKLPEQIQLIAKLISVVYHDVPTDEILGEEFEPDILGMFVGPPHGSESTEGNDVPAHVLLFVENIWDYAEGDPEIYEEEIKLTYLRELGHYFGWDEDEIAARGLD